MMHRGIVFTLLIMSSFATAQQTNEPTGEPSVGDGTSPSSFIRDDLFIYMHAGPTREYRILGSIDAGEAIEILENVDDFTQIRDSKGRVGWVETRFVTSDQPIHLRYIDLQNRLAEAESGYQQLLTENQQLTQNARSHKEQVTSLNQTVASLNEQLNALQSEDTERENEELITWFTRGGMVAGGGVLLGLLLSYLPKKKRRESEWF